MSFTDVDEREWVILHLLGVAEEKLKGTCNKEEILWEFSRSFSLVFQFHYQNCVACSKGQYQ